MEIMALRASQQLHGTSSYPIRHFTYNLRPFYKYFMEMVGELRHILDLDVSLFSLLSPVFSSSFCAGSFSASAYSRNYYASFPVERTNNINFRGKNNLSTIRPPFVRVSSRVGRQWHRIRETLRIFRRILRILKIQNGKYSWWKIEENVARVAYRGNSVACDDGAPILGEFRGKSANR